MTATVPALAAPDARPVVRFDRLLALYAVVPLGLAVAAFDLFVLHGALRSRLPEHPDRLAFFTLLFNFPHIIASHLIFLDAGYLRAYWKRALFGLAGLGAITGVCVLVGQGALFLFAMLVTHYHIIGQQVGLTGAQLRTNDWSFTAWRALSQMSGGLMLLSVLEPFARLRLPMALVAFGMLLPSTLVVARLMGRSATVAGRRFLFANQAMFWAMSACQWMGYPIFTILLPRFVHDVSAFYVYGVHDTNHNRDARPNVLYRVAGWLKIPPVVVGPLVAIAIAFVVERFFPTLLRVHVVYWLSGLHYYLEGVVWKSGTPHRQSVSFL